MNMDSKMLNTIIQKNETFSKYYILEDYLLFKIKSIKISKQEQFIFFDYTYKETKFNSFVSFNEAEQELFKRFEDYKTKFNINLQRNEFNWQINFIHVKSLYENHLFILWEWLPTRLAYRLGRD